jgi:hypothetical protein
MNEQSNLETERLAEERKLEAAVQRAVRQAVLASAYAGQPVPVARDGKVVWLQPDQIFAELGAPPLAKPDDKAGAA